MVKTELTVVIYSIHPLSEDHLDSLVREFECFGEQASVTLMISECPEQEYLEHLRDVRGEG